MEGEKVDENVRELEKERAKTERVKRKSKSTKIGENAQFERERKNGEKGRK